MEMNVKRLKLDILLDFLSFWELQDDERLRSSFKLAVWAFLPVLLF